MTKSASLSGEVLVVVQERGENDSRGFARRPWRNGGPMTTGCRGGNHSVASGRTGDYLKVQCSGSSFGLFLFSVVRSATICSRWEANCTPEMVT